MKSASCRGRSLLIIAVMLFSVTTLGLSSYRSANAQGDKSFCQQCAEDCLNEAWYAKVQCMNNGGTETECNQTYSQTLNHCNAVFCNYGGNCNLPTNY